MKKIFLFFALFALPLIPRTTNAHCPLCTAGAGAAALGAAWLGVSQTSIGVFIGAFGIAIGLWIHRAIKKSFIPYQQFLLAAFSYLSTIIPLIPLLTDQTSVYIALTGEYGSPLHNVYLINRFILGSIIGAFIMTIAPTMSSFITKLRGFRTLPYQGIVLTFTLLIISSLIIEFFP